MSQSTIRIRVSLDDRSVLLPPSASHASRSCASTRNDDALLSAASLSLGSVDASDLRRQLDVIESFVGVPGDRLTVRARATRFSSLAHIETAPQRLAAISC